MSTRGFDAQQARELQRIVTDAVREVVGELKAFASSLGDAKKGTSVFARDMGWVLNTARSEAKGFGRDVGMGMSTDALLYGGGISLENNFASNALRAAGGLPIIGPTAQLYSGPVNEATDRMTGLVSLAARYGGTFSDERLQAGFDKFLGQAQRAQAGAMRVRQFAKPYEAEAFRRMTSDAQRAAGQFYDTTMQKYYPGALNQYIEGISDQMAVKGNNVWEMGIGEIGATWAWGAKNAIDWLFGTAINQR